MEAKIPLNFDVSMPKELDSTDFDRKIMMKSLTDIGKDIRLVARRKLSSKTTSKPGQYPAKRTGRMMKSVKVHKAKLKDKYWIRVQIDSFKDQHMWYPAPLVRGRNDNSLKPRRDSIIDSGLENENKTIQALSDALDKALKGWSG